MQQIDWSKIRYAKVGLAGAYKDHRWRTPVAEAFADVPRQVARVLVLYVDQIAFAASHATLSAAHDDGLSVVLLDTFDKSQGNVFAHWSKIECENLFSSASKLNMKTVLAGSIGVSDLPLAVKTQADLIGVRGAVCENDRRSELSGRRLRDFVKVHAKAKAESNCNFISHPNQKPLQHPLGELK